MCHRLILQEEFGAVPSSGPFLGGERIKTELLFAGNEEASAKFQEGLFWGGIFW